jgi:hypothetical protein
MTLGAYKYVCYKNISFIKRRIHSIFAFLFCDKKLSIIHCKLTKCNKDVLLLVTKELAPSGLYSHPPGRAPSHHHPHTGVQVGGAGGLYTHPPRGAPSHHHPHTGVLEYR